MSLLSDIRFFLKKYLTNPIVLVGVSYLMYRIITDKTKKEQAASAIKVVETTDRYDIFLDVGLGKYVLVDKKTYDIWSSPSQASLHAKAQTLS